MTHVYVDINTQCTHSYRENVEWGSWEDSYYNSFDGVFLEPKEYNKKVPVDFEVNKGDTVFVVWAEWSTGDSFGHSNRGQTEVIHVFKDEKLADEAVRILENYPGDNFDDWKVKFQSDSGQEMSYFRSWLGYFDSLDKIHVEIARVE